MGQEADKGLNEKKRRLEERQGDAEEVEGKTEAALKRAKQQQGQQLQSSTTTNTSTTTKPQVFLENVPSSEHYHVSWMHADIVTAVVSSVKHGYIVTASRDGVVKFWKRLPVQPHETNKGRGDDTGITSAAEAKQREEAQHPCLEFVKSFTAHPKPVRALAMDAAGDTVASISQDGLVKFYDVSLFDVSFCKVC